MSKSIFVPMGRAQRAIGDEAMDHEALRLQVLGLSGQVKMLEGRLLQVERQLAAVIADLSATAQHGG